MIKKFSASASNHFDEKVIVYNPELTPERIHEFVMTPFQTLWGIAQINEDYHMTFVNRPDLIMKAWDFRKPNWNERVAIDRAFEFTVIEDPNVAVICRTDDEIRRYKHMIRRHYGVKDVWDCAILNVPLKTIFGRFIDEDEETGDIFIDIADKKSAVVVPADEAINVEFIDVIFGSLNKEATTYLRTPHEVKLTPKMLNALGDDFPEDPDDFRYTPKTEREVRKELRKLEKDETNKNLTK